jgi:hypothetical protein
VRACVCVCECVNVCVWMCVRACACELSLGYMQSTRRMHFPPRISSSDAILSPLPPSLPPPLPPLPSLPSLPSLPPSRQAYLMMCAEGHTARSACGTASRALVADAFKMSTSKYAVTPFSIAASEELNLVYRCAGWGVG